MVCECICVVGGCCGKRVLRGEEGEGGGNTKKSNQQRESLDFGAYDWQTINVTFEFS
jgi:hypothetical protein